MKTRLAFWKRVLHPTEKPWQGIGDLEWGYLFWVIVWFAIWIANYGPWYH